MNMYVMTGKDKGHQALQPEVDWKNLLSKLPVGIVVLNSAGRVEYANDFAGALLSVDLLGMDWIDVVKAAFAPRQDDGHEISLKDGRRISLATTSLTPMSGQLVTLYDVTATREFQSEIASRLRLMEIGKMSAKLAHQIRTPLASMLLYLSNLESKSLPEDKRNKFLEKIKRSVHELEQQVNDMLHYAKGGSTVLGNMTIQDLFNDIESKVAAHIQDRKAQLSICDNTDAEVFKGNLDSLSGAVQNLIHNALQAATHQPIIELRAQKRDSFIEIIVRDNGPGIPAADLENVLKPFFTTKAKGTGLGLSVVQAVVKAHYGEIKIESEVNKGTEVKLVIPINK